MGTFTGELNSLLLTPSSEFVTELAPTNSLHKDWRAGCSWLSYRLTKRLGFVSKYSYPIAEILGRRKIFTGIAGHILAFLLSEHISKIYLYLICVFWLLTLLRKENQERSPRSPQPLPTTKWEVLSNSANPHIRARPHLTIHTHTLECV